MWKMKKYSQCHVIFADIRKIDLSFKKKTIIGVYSTKFGLKVPSFIDILHVLPDQIVGVVKVTVFAKKILPFQFISK